MSTIIMNPVVTSVNINTPTELKMEVDPSLLPKTVGDIEWSYDNSKVSIAPTGTGANTKHTLTGLQAGKVAVKAIIRDAKSNT